MTSLLGAAALLLAACTAGSSSPTTSPVATGEQAGSAAAPEEGTARSFAGTVAAPEFPPGLDWLNTEHPLTLAGLRGKLVLLDFWTYGCINCIHIIPDLERLEEEYADELVVIGVHSAKFDAEGNTENIRRIILRYGLQHPVVNDADFLVWRQYGARAWPTVVLIDPAGNVVGVHAGEGVYPVVQPVVEALVREFDTEIDRTPLRLRLERDGLPATVLSFPGKVLADVARNRLFIADSNHHRVVVARLEDGEVVAAYGSGRRGFADGAADVATFAQPQGMALATDGSTLFVADTGNHAIRAVDLATGEVSTLAGTGRKGLFPPAGGPLAETALYSPWDLERDGELLYVAMAGAHQVWVLDLAAGTAAPFAGSAREGTRNGTASEAELAQPSGLALDRAGRLYFADSESSSIRFVDRGDGEPEVGLLAGGASSLFEFGDRDGSGPEARLQHPLGVAVDAGYVWVADTYNSKIKRIDPAGGAVVTLAGEEGGWRDGPEPLFYEPGGIDAAGGMLYVADTNNHVVRIVDQETGATRTLVLKGLERFLPSGDEEDFRGRTISLQPVAVAAGPGSIVLDVRLPPGYKVNPDAPSRFEWRADGGAVTLAPGTGGAVVDPSFPLEFPAEFRRGEGTLTGDISVVYCEAERESICLFDQVRVSAPLRVGDGESSVVTVAYDIELPAGLGGGAGSLGD